MPILRHPTKAEFEKKLFKATVDQRFRQLGVAHDIEYASQMAIVTTKDAVGSETAVDLLRDALSSNTARRLFSPSFRTLVQDRVAVSHRKQRSLRTRLRSALNPALRRQLRRLRAGRASQLHMNYNVLAFRTLIVSRMVDLLTEDARLLSRNH